MVRALGLKIGRIVVDAGHGGHDSGTLAPAGIQEKEVVLDVALRLGKLLKQRLGADVIYTRDDDTFIPLETRTAIANKAQADLFISVHANSSRTAPRAASKPTTSTSPPRPTRSKSPRAKTPSPTNPSTSSPTWSAKSPCRTKSPSRASSPPTSSRASTPAWKPATPA